MAAVNKIKLKKNGFSLIEVIIAMAILVIIGSAFLGALYTGIKATELANLRTTAESIGRSQIEYLKRPNTYDAISPYDVDSVTLKYSTSPDIVLPPNFMIETDAIRLSRNVLDEDTLQYELIPSNPSNIDNGIQSITITISYKNEIILILEDYLVDR
ncbi:prepilin-type N-terminal cleavage/methylation domain-containing protein [Dehalogenimonas sp. THU2]|uniref:type IV pilus modification PilV family protein n=1 Tax=Dehalogenimonas sp. THU2 TaxID=3151121 RepID=UPI003218BBE3